MKESNTDFIQCNRNEIERSLDPNKDTIVVFTENYLTYKTKYSHIFGFLTVIFETLEEKYNVIYVGNEKDTYPNLIQVKNSLYRNFVKKFCKTKEQSKCVDKSYIYNNHKLTYDYIKSKLDWLKGIKYITGLGPISTWYLILQRYKRAGEKYKDMFNEVHDYVGNDESQRAEIKAIAKIMAETFPEYCNPLAFMQSKQAVTYNVLKFLVDNNVQSLKSVDAFVNDPVFFWPVLKELPVKSRIFYFADDNRGTRCFQKFPIAELQHLVYDRKFFDTQNYFENKELHSKNFVFMGSILNVKGSRINLYDKFLKNLNVPNSAFYIPLIKQGIIFKRLSEKQKSREDHLMNINPVIAQKAKEIAEHPLYAGYLTPDEVCSTLDEYKYTLILRCVSVYDSLNYRPVQYAYHRILPFLDPQYDPDYLQIPKHIQDRLVVHNAEEIASRILYYEEHPDEYENLLNELWELFSVDKWFKPEYYKNMIFEYYE